MTRKQAKENILLTRDEFRNMVFARDNHKCVICHNEAKDAHHIIERRLWKNSGYFIDNGASVCYDCHLLCESTDISVEEIRAAAGIKNKIMPEQFYDDDIIDKWGNYILPNGQRLRGELFYDESVQKILKNNLNKFTKYVKHPRTPHLPWSEGLSSDDISVANTNHFSGNRVVVLEKMDGENTTMYNDYMHARSIDSDKHVSRHRATAFWAEVCGSIPEGYRFVMENLYALHSIPYDSLENYLYGLFVWNDKNVCLSFDDTVEWFQLIGLPMPTVLYDGIYDEQLIRKLKIDTSKQEGYVIRNASEFGYSQFKYNVAKYVRKNHVQSKNWKCMSIVPNSLKESK